MADNGQQLWLVALWRVRLFFGIFLCVLMVLAGGAKLWRPAWQEANRLKATQIEYQNTISHLTKDLQERRTAREFLTTLSANDRQKLAALVSKTPQVTSVIYALDTTVTEVGGVIEAVEVSEGGEVVSNTRAGDGMPIPPTDAAQLFFQLRLQGMDYTRLKQLLGLLETRAPLLSVDSFVISDKTPGLELNLHWFYFPNL